jgi:diaminopropionate ammonia-lyase
VTGPTPVRRLAEHVWIKDESDRWGLPAFKVVGASYAVERALERTPDATALVAASAGNHGRAVAHLARQHGLACRVFVPERSLAVRRDAIAGEGAEVVVVDGSYEDAVRAADAAAADPWTLLIADVGDSASAHDVIDGYATLFAELAEQLPDLDVVLVPVGVGSLAAAAARFGKANGVAVVGVEPADAACLTAALAAGEPVRIDTPGTVMAGMDCAEVSPAAWPDLRDGIATTILVRDDELPAAIAELERAGMLAGECAASTVVAWHRLDPPAGTRVALIGTEGRTGY